MSSVLQSFVNPAYTRILQNVSIFIIANKPVTYGLKMFMACNIGTNYKINAESYLGKSTNTNKIPLKEYFSKRLVKTVEGINRKSTMGNWFTSIKLAEDLLKTNLTLVGI